MVSFDQSDTDNVVLKCKIEVALTDVSLYKEYLRIDHDHRLQDF
jgi:hypothetical protein